MMQLMIKTMTLNNVLHLDMENDAINDQNHDFE